MATPDLSRLTLNELRTRDANTVRALHRAEKRGVFMWAAELADRSSAIRAEIQRRHDQTMHALARVWRY